MTTASKLQSITTGARTVVLAASLAIASVFPTAGLVFADGGVPTPSSQPVLSQDQAYEADPAGGLFDVEAIVVADGNGAPLLEQPALDSTVLETLQSGTSLTLRIDETDTVYSESGEIRWWPVSVNGTDGWIDGRSLMTPADYAVWSGGGKDGSMPPDSTSTRVPFDYTGELVGATAQVDADGDGLKMRSEPDASAEVVASIPEGSIVDLRIADVDTVFDASGTRWWPISFEGQDGWVSGYYLITPGTTPTAPTESGTITPDDGVTAPTPTESAQPTEQPDGDFTYVAGDWAVVRTTDMDRTNLYTSADPNSEVEGTIPHMALVEVIAQADGGWYEVRWDTIQGYIPGDLLTAGTAPRRSGDAVDPAPTPTPAAVSAQNATTVETDPFVAGDVAKIKSDSGAGVNVRSSAGTSSESIGFLADGTQVEVVGESNTDDDGDVWYEVSAESGEKGWVRADLLNGVVATVDTENTTEATDEVSDEGWILPVSNYRFTQDYGCSNLGFYSFDSEWGCAVHDGVDLAATQGTPLVAVADGTVVVSGWCDCGLGYYVEIDHGNGIHTVYGHMASQPPVAVGEQVKQGQEIGPLGSTGLSTGPHVHFMVRENGVTVDPKNYLPPIGN